MRAPRLLLSAAACWPGLAMAALFGSLLSGTPPTNLGAPAGRLVACPGTPNCVSSQAPSGDTEHAIAPLPLRGDAATAIAALATVVAAQPGAVVVTRNDRYLYATFTTPLMGFVDDVEFVADPARGVIDVRSASRLGHSDMGVNRKRVEALRTAWAEAAK